MRFSEKYIKGAQWLLPSPFTLAMLLTGLTALLALCLTEPVTSQSSHLVEIGSYWTQGFWDLLAFAMQMMLILVLGHSLALTPPATWLINQITRLCTSTASSALLVSFTTILIGLLNWGLGLILGAILARKIAEKCHQTGQSLNYPLIAACGYASLMVWHGGLSGSATLKVTEADHFLVGVLGQIPLTDTVFSTLNLTVSALLLTVIPSAMYVIGRLCQPTSLSVCKTELKQKKPVIKYHGAERLDHANTLGRLFAFCMILMALYPFFYHTDFSFITLNYINFVLFALSLFLLGNIARFSQAIEEAIGGASGIMVQFPLYAGIAGIMHHSGLIEIFSNFILEISSSQTYAIWTFISASVVNFFVPSGGGQWAVQGPILAEAASQLNVPFYKAILAFAYGDQLTNMMQPFWALPLLAITKLKAQEILPYTLILMALGFIIFTPMILLF